MNRQKGFTNIVLIVLVVVIVGVVGYFVFSKKSEPTPSEPLTYSKNDQLFTVSKKVIKILDKFTASGLMNQSQECGTNRTEQYFNSLLAKFTNTDRGIEYNFQYRGQTQDSGVWTVTIIPNRPGYNNATNFKADFDICAAGGDLYPESVSQNYLLFVSACGTGYDDGSGRPHGCDVVREFVEPTLKLQ